MPGPQKSPAKKQAEVNDVEMENAESPKKKSLDVLKSPAKKEVKDPAEIAKEKLKAEQLACIAGKTLKDHARGMFVYTIFVVQLRCLPASLHLSHSLRFRGSRQCHCSGEGRHSP